MNILARYAVLEKDTRGRKFKEKEHPYRSIYDRDRDRIIHSAAFRKLEDKTQVFVVIEGDYYRTRLTHTLEVSQIARTIARELNLNESLVEAIALAHDLGHTPFGHAGEDALNELMKDFGGFNHNVQSLKVVDYLEEKYPEFKGLNLTWETREGIVKHSSIYDRSAYQKEFSRYKSASLETQVVDIADEIAYDNHDIDDGLTSGLLDEECLNKLNFWSTVSDKVLIKYPALKKNKAILKYQIIKEMINLQVTDIIEESRRRLKKHNFKTSDEVRNFPEKIICFSYNMQKLRSPLRSFLMENFYKNYRVMRMSNKAKRFIRDIFNAYLDNPRQLPPEYQDRLNNLKTKKELKVLLCDYIASMTDWYALDEYKKFFDPYKKV